MKGSRRWSHAANFRHASGEDAGRFQTPSWKEHISISVVFVDEGSEHHFDEEDQCVRGASMSFGVGCE